MTKQEAIERFQRMKNILSIPNSDAARTIEAIDMAIHALEQEPSEDCISRQAAIDAVGKAMPQLTTPDGCGEFDHEIQIAAETFSDCMKIINDLPSVQPEIIRCKDCKWWDREPESVYGYCMAMQHGYHARNWEIGIYRKYKGDFYCADAERSGYEGGE